MEEYKENNTEFNVVGFTGVYNVTLVIMNGRNVRSILWSVAELGASMNLGLV